MANRHQPVIEILEAVLKKRGGDQSNHAIQTEKAYDGPSVDNVDVAVGLSSFFFFFPASFVQLTTCAYRRSSIFMATKPTRQAQ
jgi:hypothetical protein